MDRALLIAGSDTDVGKTVVTTALLAHGLRYGDPAEIAVMKPLQTGYGDRECYSRLFPDLTQNPADLNPLWFSAPLAPPLAADQEGRTIDLAPVWEALQRLLGQHQRVLVEALGGLGSPVTHEWTVADLAAAWHLPLVLVIPVKLGAIAQTVANVALARQHHLSLRGLILNCRTPEAETQQDVWAPIPLLENLTQTPVLGVLPWLEAPRDAQRASQMGYRAALEVAATHLNLDALWTPSDPAIVKGG